MDWNERGVHVNVQTDRQTDRNTVQALFKKMYGDSERQCKHSVTRHTYKLTDVQKHRASTMWTDVHSDKRTNRNTCKHSQTYRQTDRRTDRRYASFLIKKFVSADPF